MKNLLLALQILASTFLMMVGSPATALAKEKLTVVPHQKVCMVTNMLFPRDQIPVVHAGKTYYGCCENCKNTLSQDASSRTALDPVTNKPVDKARAVIAAREDGSVLYFESQATFKKYQK